MVTQKAPPGLPANNRRRRQTAYLDGLRGLAAFLVYLSHHVPWFYGLPNVLDDGFGYQSERYFGQLPFIRTLFTGGNASVSIFFVLSGYVLSVNHLRLLGDGSQWDIIRALVASFVKRPIRLYIPPTAISLLLALAMQLPFGLAPTLEWPVAKENLLLELQNWIQELLRMMNPFNKQGMYEHWFPYDPPAWTMSLELRGSFLIFFLVGATVPCSSLTRMLILVVLGTLLFFCYQWSLACFVGGMALAVNDVAELDSRILSKLSRTTQTVGLHLIFVVAWYLLSQTAGHRGAERSLETNGWYFLTKVIPEPYYSNEYWRFWHFPGACMLVYTVLRISWLQRFFMGSWLQFLGRISFSLYLIHIPLEWTVADRVHRTFGIIRQKFTTPFDNWLPLPDAGPVGLSTGFLFLQMIILPMNLWLAKLGTNYLDEPSVRAGKFIVGRLGLSRERATNDVFPEESVKVEELLPR